LGQQGDVLVGLSTSGKARNVIAAAEVAHARGMSVIGFTGRGGGELKNVADLCVRTPSDTTHEIQEHHLAIYHAVSLTLEDAFFPAG
jgi:D-sedoheptulose 7-phosphate isomerase